MDILDHDAEAEISLQIAMGAVVGAREKGKPLDDVFIEATAALVHTAWLERNSAHAKELDKRPYAELAEAEKEKDRAFVRAAMALQTLH